jgi:hypothetical protein
MLENGKEVQRTDVRGKIMDNGRGIKDEGEAFGYGRRTMPQGEHLKMEEEPCRRGNI